MYFDSVFGMMAKQLQSSPTLAIDVGDNSSDRVVDPDVVAAWKFVSTLVDKEKSKKPAALRGPLMALMELVSRSRQCGLGVYLKKVASPVDMLYDYYELFGDHPCCYSDLERYLPVMDEGQRSEVLKLWQCSRHCVISSL